MIDYQPFIQHITNTRLDHWVAPLTAQLDELWVNLNDGNLPRMLQQWQSLPELPLNKAVLEDIVQLQGDISGEQHRATACSPERSDALAQGPI